MIASIPNKTVSIIALVIALIFVPLASQSRPDTSDFDPRLDKWADVEPWEVLFCKQWGGHKEDITAPGARASFPIALSQLTLTLQAEKEVTTVIGAPGTGSAPGQNTLMAGFPSFPPSAPAASSPPPTPASGSSPAAAAGTPTGAAIAIGSIPYSPKKNSPEKYADASPTLNAITGAAVSSAQAAPQPTTTNKLYKVSWYIEPIAGTVDFEVFLTGDGKISLTNGVKTATNTRAEFGFEAKYFDKDYTYARIEFGNDFLEVPVVETPAPI